MTYVDAGYVVALVALAVYALSLVGRERAARRRLGGQAAHRPGGPAARPGRPGGRLGGGSR